MLDMAPFTSFRVTAVDGCGAYLRQTGTSELTPSGVSSTCPLPSTPLTTTAPQPLA